MKLFIAVILIIFSFVLAYARSSDIKKRKNESELILKLSDRIKNNLSTEMRPLFKLSQDFFADKLEKAPAFSSTDELTDFIKEKYGTLPFINEFSDTLARLPTLPMDELSPCSERLINIAEKGARESEEKYAKEGKNAFIIYPGIVTVLILILI